MLPNPPVINDQILGPANGQLADGQTNGQSNGQPDNETNGHHSNGDNGPGAGPDVTSQLVVDDNNGGGVTTVIKKLSIPKIKLEEGETVVTSSTITESIPGDMFGQRKVGPN